MKKYIPLHLCLGTINTPAVESFCIVGLSLVTNDVHVYRKGLMTVWGNMPEARQEGEQGVAFSRLKGRHNFCKGSDAGGALQARKASASLGLGQP